MLRNPEGPVPKNWPFPTWMGKPIAEVKTTATELSTIIAREGIATQRAEKRKLKAETNQQEALI